jgi:4-amino-4-deoxy-L-arabinose transferase-like glycosyltransferase
MSGRRRPIAAFAFAGLLVLALLLYNRGTDAPANYDEGVYLASLDALRHGQGLGTDVYASQPPGFYVLLQALVLPGMDIDGIRIAFLLVALAGLVAAYAIGRRLAGPSGGLLAAALLAVTAPYPVQAARVEADTASVALALAAVAVAMHAGRSTWRWVAAGLLAGCAISVKLLAFPVFVPLAVLLVTRRSWRATGACLVGAVLVWVALAIAYAGAIGELWESVVSDHRNARRLGPSLADNADRVLLHPLDWRTVAAALVVAGIICCALFLRRIETLALGAWIVASAAFLVYQRPLLDHHLVLLAATLAVPAGAGLAAAAQRLPRPARVAAIAAIVLALVAGLAQEARRLDRLGNVEPADVLAAAHELRSRTTPDELVGSDLPIVAYLADRRMPGRLVDTSFVRLGTGSLTDTEILATLDRHRVRAVVAGREFTNRSLLLRELAARYPKRVRTGAITIYLAP